MLQDFETVMNYNPRTTEIRLQVRVTGEKPYSSHLWTHKFVKRPFLKTKQRRNYHGLKPKQIKT